jgi:hypothetical protein
VTTGWTTGRSEFDPRQRQRIFPLASVSRPAMGPTQPPVQWVPGSPFPKAKVRPGCNADHSPPSSTEVENEELYLLSLQAPAWRVAGLFYFLLFTFYQHTLHKIKEFRAEGFSGCPNITSILRTIAIHKNFIKQNFDSN